MYLHNQRLSSEEVQALRRGAGQWLAGLRERKGLSQSQFAKSVGMEHYAFISQLETGRARIPPDKYRIWAEALDVDLKYFVRELMKYYDPVTHALLFD